MAYVHPDKWSPDQWRKHFETVAAMRGRAWRVFWKCPTCGARGEVNLAEVQIQKGPDFSLWDKRPKCPTMLCRDRVRLTALPPHATRPFGLADQRTSLPQAPEPGVPRAELGPGQPVTANRLLEAGRRFWLCCTTCNHRGEVDLLKMRLDGRGDLDIGEWMVAKKMPCSKCGQHRANGEIW